MKSDLTDIDVHVHDRNDKAVLVSDDGDEGSAVWLPLSQVEIEPHPNMQRVYVLTVPEWLATDRGLI